MTHMLGHGSTDGNLPPVIQSRTRQRAHDNGESLTTETTTNDWVKVESDSKREMKLKRELKAKSDLCEATLLKKKLKNKLKHERRKRLKKQDISPEDKTVIGTVDNSEEISKASEAHQKQGVLVETVIDSDDTFEEMKETLKAQQKPGVLYPQDSCTKCDMAPELEAIALKQFNLKKGLKAFGNDGLTSVGKEVEQLHVQKLGSLLMVTSSHVKKRKQLCDT